MQLFFCKCSLFGTSSEFELYCNDTLCVKGTTRWVYFDIKSGRPTKISDELLAKYEPEAKSVFAEKKLPKIEVPENFTTEVAVIVCRHQPTCVVWVARKLLYTSLTRLVTPCRRRETSSFNLSMPRGKPTAVRIKVGSRT